jgi:hypothetical protein
MTVMPFPAKTITFDPINQSKEKIFAALSLV